MISTAIAPAKIILFGEHAVVHGYPAIALPVRSIFTEVAITSSANDSTVGIEIEAIDINLKAQVTELPEFHPLRRTVELTLESCSLDIYPDCIIKISSDIPIGAGLGSGASVTVALIRAMASFVGKELEKSQISKIAYEIEKIHHGNPSGIDNSVVTYDHPLYFIRDQRRDYRIKKIELGKKLNFLIADSGTRTPTKETVHDLDMMLKTETTQPRLILREIGEIAESALPLLEGGNLMELGLLMNRNHILLSNLDLSNKELDNLINSAMNSGAYGAKLSGGGRGGCVIALVEAGSEKKSKNDLLKAGAVRVFNMSI